MNAIDDFGVCCVCLADLLRPIIAQEQLRNGRDLHGQMLDGSVHSGNNGKLGTVGAVLTLAEESGVNPRRIGAILACEFATVGLRNADNLLCALNRPDLVHALDVFPRKRGRRIGSPGDHVCQLVAACRVAPLEPSPTAEGSRRGGTPVAAHEAEEMAA